MKKRVDQARKLPGGQRNQANQERILAVFQETNSRSRTAEITGYHYVTVCQAIRRASGLCVRCTNPRVVGRQHCRDCLLKLSEEAKARRKERLWKGLCEVCDSPVEHPSKTRCGVHRRTRANANAAYRERSRKVQGTLTTGKRREYDLRRNHGENAVTVWRRLEGHCALCHAAHEDTAVHLHHIDENPSNGAEDNLTLLCQSCHSMLHRLLLLPNVPEALSWVARTYPDRF